jgi:hypothetical protein
MPQPNDLSRSLVALDQNSTIITVVDLCRRVALRRLSGRFLLGRLAGTQPVKFDHRFPRHWLDEEIGQCQTSIDASTHCQQKAFHIAGWRCVASAAAFFSAASRARRR